MATLTQLTQRVTRRIGQVPGSSVQVYSETAIAEMIQHIFDVLFVRAWWEQFMHWQTLTLDGTTGVVTTDIEAQTNPVVRFADIRIIFPGTSDRELGRFTATRNPTNITGTLPRFIEPFGTRIFRVVPVTATGEVTIHYKSKPTNFVSADEIDFDEQVLVLGATYDYLEDDGTNPGATEKFLNLFNSRVKALLAERHNIPIDSNPYRQSSVSQWWQS